METESLKAEGLRQTLPGGADIAMEHDSPRLPLPFSQPVTPVSATHESVSFHHSNSSLVSVTGVSNHPPTAKTPPGRVSLHHYRKIMSQADRADAPEELKGRTLKRKPATVNLNPTKTNQTFFTSLSSPSSSAPSSPPPLSFSQSLHSVISYPLDEDLDIATTPVLFDPNVHLYPLSLSPLDPSREHQSNISPRGHTRSRQDSHRLHAFRERLRVRRASKLRRLSHRRPTSDSALLRFKLERTVLHDGTSFEILNPRDSLELARIVSSPEDQPRRSFENSLSSTETQSTLSGHDDSIRMRASDDSNRPSTGRSVHEDALRASPSVSASFGPKFPSATPGLLESEDPFCALPHLTNLPGIPAHLVRPGSLDMQPGKESFDETIRSLAINHPSLANNNINPWRVGTGKSALLNARKLSGKISRLFGKKSGGKSKAKVIEEDLGCDRTQIQRVDSKGSPHRVALQRRPSLVTDMYSDRSVNQHQPNYNSAFGRIDKPSIVSQRIRRIPGRRILKERPSAASIDQDLNSPTILAPTPSLPSTPQEEWIGLEGPDNINIAVGSPKQVAKVDCVGSRPEAEGAAYRANRFHSMQSSMFDGRTTYQDIMNFFLVSSTESLNTDGRLSEESSQSDLNPPRPSFQDMNDDEEQHDVTDGTPLPAPLNVVAYPMASIFRPEERASQLSAPNFDSNGQLVASSSYWLRDSNSSVVTAKRDSPNFEKGDKPFETTERALSSMQLSPPLTLTPEDGGTLSHPERIESSDELSEGKEESQWNKPISRLESDGAVENHSSHLESLRFSAKLPRVSEHKVPGRPMVNTIQSDQSEKAGNYDKEVDLITMLEKELSRLETPPSSALQIDTPLHSELEKELSVTADEKGRSNANDRRGQRLEQTQDVQQVDQLLYKREGCTTTASLLSGQSMYNPSISQDGPASRPIYPVHQVHPAHRELVKVEDQPAMVSAIPINVSTNFPSHLHYRPIAQGDDPYRFQPYQQPNFNQPLAVRLPLQTDPVGQRVRPATTSSSRPPDHEKLTFPTYEQVVEDFSLHARPIRRHPSRSRCNVRMLFARVCC